MKSRHDHGNGAGEVRAPTEPGQEGPELVVDVAELIWEPIAD